MQMHMYSSIVQGSVHLLVYEIFIVWFVFDIYVIHI